GPDRLRREDVDDRVLEAACERGDRRLREPSFRVPWRVPLLGTCRLDDPTCGRLQAAEAEVVRVAEPGTREGRPGDCGRPSRTPVVRARTRAVRGLGRALDCRTARIAEAEEPTDLVERLAGRVVERRPEQA